MSAILTRPSAYIFSAVLIGLGGCYATGYSDEPATGGPLKPDAAARKAPPPKRAAAKKKARKPAQTVRQAWRLICHAEQLSGAHRETGRGKRGDVVASWLAKNLKNKRVIYWYLAFGKMKQPEQPAAFQAAARRAGFSACPLYTLLFAPTSDAGAEAATHR